MDNTVWTLPVFILLHPRFITGSHFIRRAQGAIRLRRTLARRVRIVERIRNQAGKSFYKNRPIKGRYHQPMTLPSLKVDWLSEYYFV